MNSRTQGRPIQRYALGLTSLCLMLSLLGCATSGPEKDRPQERFLPSRSLLLPTPIPEPPVTSLSNWQLKDVALDWLRAARSCNVDKAAIEAEAYGITPDAPTPVKAEEKPRSSWWPFGR